jgi:hypothetical protein
MKIHSVFLIIGILFIATGSFLSMDLRFLICFAAIFIGICLILLSEGIKYNRYEKFIERERCESEIEFEEEDDNETK